MHLLGAALLIILSCMGVEVHGVDVPECITSIRDSTAVLSTVASMNTATSTVSVQAYKALKDAFASDIGNYDECIRIPQAHHCLAGSVKKSNRYATPPAFSGICVPRQCGELELESDDVISFLQESTYIVAQEPKNVYAPLAQQQLQYYMKLNQTLVLARSLSAGYTCGTGSATMTTDRYVFFIVFTILTTLVLVATVYHMMYNGSSIRSELPHEGSGVAASRSFLDAFSLVKNVTYVFEDSDRSNPFACLDGLRAISMLWIILGHTIAIQASLGYVNPADIVPPEGVAATLPFQLFFSARFAVDTFFFISGFLVIHSLLKRLDPPRTLVHSIKPARVLSLSEWLPFYYLHRLLRILPPYMFCLCLWWKIGVLMGQGPFWFRWLSFEHRCDMYWWTNLLFVNNLIPYNTAETDECLYHSWYLANDFQFYVICPIFLIAFLYKKLLGWTLVTVTLVGSMALSAVYTVILGASPHSFDGLWVTLYSHEMYTKPQFRIPPYLIGMAAGMLWHEKCIRTPRYRLPDVVARVLMVGACVLVGFLIFCGKGAYQRRPCDYLEIPKECGSGWSITSRVLYNTFTKPLWGLAVAIITLVSANDQGGPVQHFLSHRLWTPLAKLSFAAYLVHPLIINVWYLGQAQKSRWSPVGFCMDYIAIVVVSFSVGLVVMMLVESPSQRLWRIIEKHVMNQKGPVTTAYATTAVAGVNGGVEVGSRTGRTSVAHAPIHTSETSVQPSYPYYRVTTVPPQHAGYGSTVEATGESKRMLYSGQPRRISEK